MLLIELTYFVWTFYPPIQVVLKNNNVFLINLAKIGIYVYEYEWVTSFITIDFNA